MMRLKKKNNLTKSVDDQRPMPTQKRHDDSHLLRCINRKTKTKPSPLPTQYNVTKSENNALAHASDTSRSRPGSPC